MSAESFSPVATFIALRETLEAGIIIAVLLGFVEQIIPQASSPQGGRLDAGSSRTELLARPSSAAGGARSSEFNEAIHDYSTFNRHVDDQPNGETSLNQSQSSSGPITRVAPTVPTGDASSDTLSDDDEEEEDRIDVEPIQFRPDDRAAAVRSLKVQIWTGALLGLAGAATIGAIFLYVFYTFAHDLWQDAENLWEGIFCGLASIIILVMGIAFLRLPHARTKWRLKLLAAVEGKRHHHQHYHHQQQQQQLNHGKGRKGRSGGRAAAGGWILFGLPFITVLREGLEGVVFLGGIGITDSPRAIFFGAVVGVVIGATLAYALFSGTAPLSLQRFTTISTLLLFLIGAGLASRSAYSLERQYFINGVGTAAAESGNGPGSYRVAGNIWKLTWGDPEVGSEGTNGFYQLAQSLVGWNNIGTVWTVSIYQAYWLVIILTLMRMKYVEGRTSILGRRSRRGWEIQKSRRRAARQEGEEEGLLSPVTPGSAGSTSASRVSANE